MPPPALRRYGEHLLELLAAQRRVPDAELPPRLPPPLDARQRDLVKKLKAQVRAIAEQLAMAPEVLLQGKDYELLLREACRRDVTVAGALAGLARVQVIAPLRRLLAERDHELLCQVFRSSAQAGDVPVR